MSPALACVPQRPCTCSRWARWKGKPVACSRASMRARLCSRCAGLCPRTAPSARHRRGHRGQEGLPSPAPRPGGTPRGATASLGLVAAPSPGTAEGPCPGSGERAAGLILTVNVDEAGDEAEPLGRLPAQPLAEAQGEGLSEPCPPPNPPLPPHSPPAPAGAWHWRSGPPTAPAAPAGTGGTVTGPGSATRVSPTSESPSVPSLLGR